MDIRETREWHTLLTGIRSGNLTVSRDTADELYGLVRGPKPIQFAQSTAPYDPKKLGKPWVAVLDFRGYPNVERQFGQWIGTPGEAGELRIVAEPGSLLAFGQKPRKNDFALNPIPHFVLNPDGTLTRIGTYLDAVRYWLDKTTRPANPATVAAR